MLCSYVSETCALGAVTVVCVASNQVMPSRQVLKLSYAPYVRCCKARGMLERRWSAGCLWGLSQTDHGRVQPCWKRPERGGARELHDLVDMLAPLEDPLLTQIVSDTAEALEKAHAKQNSGKLREDDVQELFVSLLTALEAARPPSQLPEAT